MVFFTKYLLLVGGKEAEPPGTFDEAVSVSQETSS